MAAGSVLSSPRERLLLFIAVLLAAIIGATMIPRAITSSHLRRLQADLKALTSQDPAERDAAAGSIRRIVAKYPSGTINILEADGGEARWNQVLRKVKRGMTESEMRTIVSPLGGSLSAVVRPDEKLPALRSGNYQLDARWRVAIEFNLPPAGPPTVNRVVQLFVHDQVLVAPAPGSTFTGTWTQYRE